MKILAGMIESKSSLLRKALTLAANTGMGRKLKDGIIVNWNSFYRMERRFRAKMGCDYGLSLEIGAPFVNFMGDDSFFRLGTVLCLLKKQGNIITADIVFSENQKDLPLATFTYSSYREAVEAFMGLMGGAKASDRTYYLMPGDRKQVDRFAKDAISYADKLDAGVPLDY